MSVSSADKLEVLEQTSTEGTYKMRIDHIASGGGGGGTTDYEDLDNKPSVNNTELIGNKTSSQLGLQNTLVSGTNIKTINNQSILGSGNINIQGGSGGQNVWYGVCPTSNGTQTKVVTTSSNDFSLVAGSMISVLFDYTNSSQYPKLNVDGTGAKFIRIADNTVSDLSYRWRGGQLVTFVYSGTEFILSDGLADTAYYGVTRLSSSISSEATNLAATSSAVKQAYDLANGKQDALVSGTNIKTINNESILGSGNISVGGGGGITLDDVYPVGSIYMSVNNTNPGTLFGGTWQQIENRFLLAAGSSYTAGDTGGSASRSYTPAGSNTGTAITVNQMPSHQHEVVKWTKGTKNTAAKTGFFSTNASGGSGWQMLTGYDSTRTHDCGTTATGGGQTHTHTFNGTAATINTMPPYLVVYMWQRTA